MVNDYKKHDLFGRTLLQRIGLTPPFRFDFPVDDQACFLYVRQGDFNFQIDGEVVHIPTNYALFLNCMHSGKRIIDTGNQERCEILIVTFYPDILKKIYDRELPPILKMPTDELSNQSSEKISNDFLIEKYIEGLLFYFENPSLISDDILILKVREILLLLSQTKNAQVVRHILSQLFSPVTYTFRQIIDGNLFSHLTIEELARRNNLSVSSFKREFTRIYQSTPANYIRTKKLEKAAELLRVSNQRISEIAFDCGFNDLANFTKGFTARYKQSPSAYRLQQLLPDATENP